jgi:acetyl esterase/lipase
MKRLVFFLMAALPIAYAQTSSPETVLLWPDGAPGAQGNAPEDKPSLTIFPASGSGSVPTAVVVCPGGGYVHLADVKEGSDIARWLNQHGISAFVVKYRLGPKYHHPVEFGDVQRAIRYVRTHAKEYGYAANRIGIWGFSAGGHLASTAGTHFDNGDAQAADPINRASSRPDFMILAYPVITFEEPYLHRGSRDNLLGKTPAPELIELLSNEKQVTKETPPTFLFATTDDPVVPVENSVHFYLACRKMGVPVEMHLYRHGPHGVGLAQSFPELKTWPDLLANWLTASGLR